MAQSTRTFRVFVSSTFSDLKAERNALQERVFPRLRQLAADHGCRFQPIDLRWGVSDEASLDQQAMNICLSEVERCQQVSPRPNFIILLGDRYGWCPPPAQVPAEEFEQLKSAVSDEADRHVLEEWYSLDKNAKPMEWHLKPRLRGSEYESYENWQKVEARLQAILEEAATKIGLPPERMLSYSASATEQEISAGALRVREAPEHVFAFFRSLEGMPREFDSNAFIRLAQARLKENIPAGLSTAGQELANQVLQGEGGKTARDFDQLLRAAVQRTPKATPERDVLTYLHQALVDTTAKDFQNLHETEWSVDEKALQKQRTLKERLQQYVPDNIRRFTARWQAEAVSGEMISTEHIDQLCEDVYNALSRLVLEEIDHPHALATAAQETVHLQASPALDAEGLAHLRFAGERLQVFIGREDVLGKIAAHLQAQGNRSLVVSGKGGTGKSSLVAKAIQQTQEAHPGAEIAYRFIGVTPASSDGRSLLESLCQELSRRYGAETGTIPTDYRDLVPEFGKRLALATAEKPLILFLDSLDQLSTSQGARSLVWLPNELPEHVTVITTSRPDEDTYKAMQGRQAVEIELGGLKRQNGDEILSLWLAGRHRTLQPLQSQEVLDKFEQSGGNPLYLKLAFEEARLWTSFSVPETLAPTVEGIIQTNMFDRLKNEGNHGKALVEHALAYLAASRHGLAEDELVDLLSRDFQVYEWFFKKTYHLPADLIHRAVIHRREQAGDKGQEKSTPQEEQAAFAWLKGDRTPPDEVTKFLQEVLPRVDGPRLPVVLWSRLSFDLAPYLTERMVDGSALLNFYHRELGDVSKKVFLAGEHGKTFHTRLGDYFRLKADPAGDHTWTGGSKHGLSELPYHLTEAGLLDQVYAVLTDFKFLEHKAAEVDVLIRTGEDGKPVNTYTGVLQLQEDYEHALAAMGGGGGREGRAPLILTALETSKGLMVYCPVCNKASPIQKEMLDSVITCPQEECKAPIKLNPFTVKREL